MVVSKLDDTDGRLIAEIERRRPAIGSLWRVSGTHHLLGHEDGDVIIIVRLANAFDELKAMVGYADITSAAVVDTGVCDGYMCLNRRGVVFYPSAWWSDVHDTPHDAQSLWLSSRMVAVDA